MAERRTFWPRTRVGRLRMTVLLVALAVTVVKLLLAALTAGTNDVLNYAEFAKAVRHYGPIEVYGHRIIVAKHAFPAYNHPPLVGWMLAGMNGLTDIAFPFKFWLRVSATLSDVVSSVLIFELVRARRSLGQAGLAGVLVACSPALIIVSGYHGNTDPIFLMFGFLSLYLLVYRRSAFLAGLSFGASISVKIVPIVALPVLLLMAARSGRRRLGEFVGGAALVFVVLWVPVIVKSWHPFARDVLGYKGYPGKWGLPEIFAKVGASNHAIRVLEGPGRLPLLLVCAGVPLLIAWRRPTASIMAFGMSLVLVLLLSTATGGRYLVWAVGAAFLVDVPAAVVYNVVASTLLIVVYNRWSSGHWDRAIASPWTHNEIILAGIAWLTLLAVAIVGLWKLRYEPKVGSEARDITGDEHDALQGEQARLVGA